jgi:hypothetical protein
MSILKDPYLLGLRCGLVRRIVDVIGDNARSRLKCAHVALDRLM